MSKSDRHHRRSTRLKGYDYTQAGAYFVPLVTWQRKHLFGQIKSGQMHLNPCGCLVQNEFRLLGKRIQGVDIGEFIVMPNHLHAIIVINDNHVLQNSPTTDHVGAGHETSILENPDSRINVLHWSINSPVAPPFPNPTPLDHTPVGPALGHLGAIMRAYKSRTTRLINDLNRTWGKPVWQRNYYDHIIRNENEWDRICDYITTNPLNWETDEETDEHPTSSSACGTAAASCLVSAYPAATAWRGDQMKGGAYATLDQQHGCPNGKPVTVCINSGARPQRRPAPTAPRTGKGGAQEILGFRKIRDLRQGPSTAPAMGRSRKHRTACQTIFHLPQTAVNRS